MGRSLEDAELVKRAKKGEKWAFTTLVDRYHDNVFGFIHSKTYDIATVEDIVQDTFLIAYRSLGNCRKPASFRSWLFSIANNIAIKTISKRQRMGHSIESLPERVAEEKGAELAEENAERLVQLERALESLPGEMKRVIVLKYYHALTCEEISTKTRKPIGTIRTWLVRGQEKLRSCLRGKQ